MLARPERGQRWAQVYDATAKGRVLLDEVLGRERRLMADDVAQLLKGPKAKAPRLK